MKVNVIASSFLTLFSVSRESSDKSFLQSLLGLPDGIFSDQNYQFEKNFDGLEQEQFGIFYVLALGAYFCHLV
jgi:hypothetical protein